LRGRTRREPGNRKFYQYGERSQHRNKEQDAKLKRLYDRITPMDEYWGVPPTKQTKNWRDYTSMTLTREDGSVGTIWLPKVGTLKLVDLTIHTGDHKSYPNDVYVAGSGFDYERFFFLAEKVIDYVHDPDLAFSICDEHTRVFGGVPDIPGQGGSLPQIPGSCDIIRFKGKRTGRVRAPRKRRHQRRKTALLTRHFASQTKIVVSKSRMDDMDCREANPYTFI
jgi:hypothetical protein